MRGLVFIILVILVSCKNTQSSNYTNKNAVDESYSNGEKLIKAYCYSCHNASTPHETRIAPPMFAVKNHYMSDTSSEKEFISQFTAFTLDPKEQKSKMKGAIEKFGLMPKQYYFKKGDIEAIAAYVYNSKLEKPKGSHKNQGKGKGKHWRRNKKDLGFTIANKTQQKLASNLIQTLNKEGVTAALEFCNVKALPITKEMASDLNANIKRVTDKPRNQKNKANEKEVGLIAHFQNMINNDVAYEPIVENLNNGKTQFYSPIVTNQLCLQCHGTTNEIHKKALKTITTLYPNDQALGYSINEVRGLWSIQF